MPTWEIVAGVVAAAVALWGRLRMIVDWLTGWVVVTRRTDTGLGQIVLAYLNVIAKRARAQGEAYGSAYEYIIPLERNARVAFQVLLASRQTFWRGLRPMWYSARSVQDTELNSALTDHNCQFSFLRGTFDWERLLVDAMGWHEHVTGSNSSRFAIIMHQASRSNADSDGVETRPARGRRFTPKVTTSDTWHMRIVGWRSDDIRLEAPSPPAEQLSLTPALEGLMGEISFWHTSRKWYEDRGVPWRRGYVFHGPPGTGKTSYARALAEKLDIPIHVFDLASMSNFEFRAAWNVTTHDTPCVALIEDIDAVFEGRNNVVAEHTHGSLTFDCLLNCIDGAEKSDGVLLILTTNHLSSIDEALIDRPGRVDRVVEFGPLDLSGRLKLARRILGDDVLARRIAEATDGATAATIQERCFRLAIEQRFTERDSA